MIPLRCAAYARFSSDRQSPASIVDQVRKCRDYAERQGWQILDQHIYTDEAVSGATDDREGLRRLLEAATSSERPFDAILIDDTSRLSRKMSDSLRITEELRFAGVRLIFVSQGIDSDSEQAEVLLATHGIVDSLYIRELGKKTYRGLEGLALRGLHTGGYCFGYRSNAILDSTQTDAHGRPLIVGARLVVDEAQAETVRRIFTLYSSGRSLKQIARLLNAEGVPSSRPGRTGSAWCHSSVRKILLNDRYRGLVFWGRTRNVRTPKGGQVKRSRPPTEWVMAETPEQRIVSDELWEAVERQRERVKQLYANTGKRTGLLRGRATRYLFSGLVKCGVCNANLNIVAGGKARPATYGCPQAPQGACSNRLRIRRDVLETRLLERLQAEVLHPEVVDYTLLRFEKELNKALSSVDDESEQLRRKKAQLKKEVHNLTQALADGYSPAITGELAVRERELASITDQLLSIRPTLIRTRMKDIRTFVRRRLADIRGLLNSDVAKAKTELFKHIQEIRLYPDGQTYKAAGEWDLLGGATMVQPGCSAATTSSGGM